MEKDAEFCTLLFKGDGMISFDVKSRYFYIRIHRDMLEDFVYNHNEKCYQYLAIPFDWGRASY